MHRFACFLTFVAVTGCTESAPDLEALGETEQAPRANTEPDYVIVPEGPAPAAAWPTEPPPIHDGPRFEPVAGEEACGSVTAKGFPAISRDGSVVVTADIEHLQLSMVAGSMWAHRYETADGTLSEETAISLGTWYGEEDFEDEAAGECAATNAKVREAAERVNDRLARKRWRAMETLPIEPVDADFYDHEAYLEFSTPRERGVQVLVRHGEVIARIAGVRVLERHPATVGGDPYRLYADRETGTVVLMTQACIGESCTCDPAFRSQVMHWSPETFAAIDERPCIPDPYDEGGCEPVDYGFNGAPFPWSL